MQFNVNASEIVQHTNRLERISKNAMPRAVRNTLNQVALLHKQKTLEYQAKKTFDVKAKTFFKANSKVEFAKGNDLNSMQSVMGMKTIKKKGQNDFAVENLERQEFGGKTPKRSFIPVSKQKGGKAKTGRGVVKPRARLSQISNLVNARNAKGKNDKEKFVKSVIHAGVGGHVLAEFKGRSFLWKVKGFTRDRNGKWKFKIDKLYSFKEGRQAKQKATPFIKPSSNLAMKKVNDIYIKNAEEQFNRIR
jgi:hypothetical protein